MVPVNVNKKPWRTWTDKAGELCDMMLAKLPVSHLKLQTWEGIVHFASWSVEAGIAIRCHAARIPLSQQTTFIYFSLN